jgi:hypothetical protein
VTTWVAIAIAPGTPPPSARFPAFFKITFNGNRSDSFFISLTGVGIVEGITMRVSQPTNQSVNLAPENNVEVLLFRQSRLARH